MTEELDGTSSRTRAFIASSIYGALVFVGAIVLGLAVAPEIAIASGYYAIDTDARYALSLLTLRGIPYLLGLSVVSGGLYTNFSSRRLGVRGTILVANTLAVWLIGASISLAILG